MAPTRYKLRRRLGAKPPPAAPVKAQEQEAEQPCAKRPRRKSARGSLSAVEQLASLIVQGKRVVFVTGAGLSVASGVRPFRTSISSNGHSHSHGACTTSNSSTLEASEHSTVNPSMPREGLWNNVIWNTATRKAFRKDAVRWYNDFWMPYFLNGETYRANTGHQALQELLESHENVRQITQNIDGLQPPSDRMIEAHGCLNLYKCCPDQANDTDSEDDSDSDSDSQSRRVQLGHLRKSRENRKSSADPVQCPYQYLQSLPPCQLEPESARSVLQQQDGSTTTAASASSRLEEAPTCPVCGSDVMPQALLFDEGYHSHTYYRFQETEEWLNKAECIVFVGTSFAVHLTSVALDHAREQSLPVFNFNLADLLQSTVRLNVSNITGPAVETLPALAEACRRLQQDEKAIKTTTTAMSMSDDEVVVTDASI